MNYYEARFIVALLDYINTIFSHKISENEDEEESSKYSIGVIVPYKAQENLIHKIMAEEKLDSLKNIQVSTVDAFQGAERDVIILSCVRTMSLGFLDDY
jgi:superfamily I DNA and/or RNA helicase